MGWGAEFAGMLQLTLQTAISLKRRKLRLNRTNQFGVEQFSSYSVKLGVNIKEGALRFILLVILNAGIVTLGFRFEDSWGSIVTLPVCALILFLLFGS